MPISSYVKELRERIGTDLLMLTGVGAVVRDASGHILLVLNRVNHRWGIPAGGIEPGEAPAQAVVREVWEETGLHVEPVDLVGVFGGEGGFRVHYPNGDQVEYTVIVFECRIVGGTLAALDGEALELRFYSVEEARSLQARYPLEIFAESGERAGPLFQWDPEWLECCRRSI